MKAFALVTAFAVVAIGWAIHPGIGVFAALLAYGAIDGLFSE